MSAENTNAGGGETIKLLSDALHEAVAMLEVDPEADAPGSDLYTWLRTTPRIALDAALSAQSTGSGGVAAEPVAWAYEWRQSDIGRWRQAASEAKPCAEPNVRNIRPLYEHPPVAAEPVAGWKLVPVEPTQAMWAAYRNADEGAILFQAAYRAMLAAAPTPPAGGGETETGDLNSLSAGATPDEVANAVMQLDWAKPSKALQWRDYEDTVEQRFRDVEAAVAAIAPAAPRKGPSEEEIAKTIFEKGNIGVSWAEWLTYVERHPSASRSMELATIRRQARAILALLTPADRGETQAVGDVLAERRRQVEAEGWSPDHDDTHRSGEMAAAAGVYALVASGRFDGIAMRYWPWDFQWWKPCDARRNLVKAGALILAEIERLDRAFPSPDQNRGEPDQGGEAR